MSECVQLHSLVSFCGPRANRLHFHRTSFGLRWRSERYFMTKLSMWQSISGLGRNFVLFLCALGLGLVLVATANAAPPDNEGESATPPETTAAQPRATFPYTIRSRDSLGSIAEEFAVAVAQLARLNRISEVTELIAAVPLNMPTPLMA